MKPCEKGGVAPRGPPLVDIEAVFVVLCTPRTIQDHPGQSSQANEKPTEMIAPTMQTFAFRVHGRRGEVEGSISCPKRWRRETRPRRDLETNWNRAEASWRQAGKMKHGKADNATMLSNEHKSC